MCVSWLVLSSHLLYSHVHHDLFWALTSCKCVSWLVLSSHFLYMYYISNRLPSLWQTAQILYAPLHCIRKVHNWPKNLILSKLSSPQSIVQVRAMITPCAWWAISFIQASSTSVSGTGITWNPSSTAGGLSQGLYEEWCGASHTNNGYLYSRCLPHVDRE